MERRGSPVLALVGGLILGIGLALLLQQAGIWPLAGLGGLLPVGVAALVVVVLCTGIKPAGASQVIVLIITVVITAAGLSGLFGGGQQGFINGGCTVTASSDLDSTTVKDSSRGNPFDVDPEGSLTWKATSPSPITDHMWKISTDVFGVDVTLADGGDPNTGLSKSNGDTESIPTYIEKASDASGFPIPEIRGIFLVTGFISGSGMCDGAGWVRVQGSPFDGPIGLASIILIVIAIIIIVVACRRRRLPVA